MKSYYEMKTVIFLFKGGIGTRKTVFESFEEKKEEKKDVSMHKMF